MNNNFIIYDFSNLFYTRCLFLTIPCLWYLFLRWEICIYNGLAYSSMKLRNLLPWFGFYWSSHLLSWLFKFDQVFQWQYFLVFQLEFNKMFYSRFHFIVLKTIKVKILQGHLQPKSESFPLIFPIKSSPSLSCLHFLKFISCYFITRLLWSCKLSFS